MASHRILRLIVISLFALVLAGMIALFQIGQESEKLSRGLTSVGGSIGGAFTLSDQDGKPFTDKNLEGSYSLIYFGFTFCPAICPTELAKMTEALHKMGTAARAIQPVFITIDPARDTIETMKQYIGLFGERLIGLTGTAEQVKQAAAAYKVYYARVEDDSASDYTMDHSSYIYFMAPDGTALHIFKMEDSADEMARIMQAWLDSGAY